jgi:high potential iron-sulfur protein
MKNNKPSMPRRALLKGAAMLATTLAVTPLAAQQNRKKPQQPGMRIRTREEVGYRDEPYLGRTCSKCVLYAGDGKCVILSEPVSAEGWCTQWVPNTVG